LADAGAVAQGFGQAEYQLLLLERHVGAGVFEFANNLRQSQIKRRILMLSKRKSRGPTRLKPLLALPLTALLALAFAEPRPAASAPGAADQEKAAAAEKAAAERATVAKRKLEDLKSLESRLIKTYAEAQGLAQKREVLDKLRDVLRAQEECTWVLTGKPGVPEALVPAVPAALELPVPVEGAVPERLAPKAELTLTPGAEEYRLQQKLKDLRLMEQELKLAIEEARESEKKQAYAAKLTDILKLEEELKLAAVDMTTARKEREALAAEGLKLLEQERELAHAEQELRIAAEQTQDPDKKAEYKARLAEVRRAIEEMKPAVFDSHRVLATTKAADLEKQLTVLKEQQEKFQALLRTNLNAADRSKTEDALKKNLVQQKEIELRLAQLREDKTEPIR
jgi:hypothetical protein